VENIFGPMRFRLIQVSLYMPFQLILIDCIILTILVKSTSYESPHYAVVSTAKRKLSWKTFRTLMSFPQEEMQPDVQSLGYKKRVCDNRLNCVKVKNVLRQDRLHVAHFSLQQC
jgi:hypothetical protein